MSSNFRAGQKKVVVGLIVMICVALFAFQNCSGSGGATAVSPAPGAPPITGSFSLDLSNATAGNILTITSSDIDLSTVSDITIAGLSQVILSKSTGELKLLIVPGTTAGSVVVTTSSGNISSSTSLTITGAGAAPTTQEGNKLVGTNAIPLAIGSRQGTSVALSADGNTLVVGAHSDNTYTGAAYVFTRTAGVWTQQGNKLIGAGAVGSLLYFGYSVAISADGNTILVGGYQDDSSKGAVWVYTRSAGVWTQQGNKLVGSDAAGNSVMGYSVSLSADGNTALFSGYGDDSGIGAAWIFTRSNGVWTQQGNKLIGTGGSYSQQGASVALSADGNTAIIGGTFDNSQVGAAWIFTKSNGVWTQQGNKLVGTGAVGTSNQGYSVALSADGNTAIVGGRFDDSALGAAWIFTRTNGVWTQQGSKLVGTGSVGSVLEQGHSVALSADGNIALVGGPADNFQSGAVWYFTRSAGVWTQDGSKVIGTGGSGRQGHSVALSLDGKTVAVGGVNDNSAVGATWVFVAP